MTRKDSFRLRKDETFLHFVRNYISKFRDETVQAVKGLHVLREHHFHGMHYSVCTFILTDREDNLIGEIRLTLTEEVADRRWAHCKQTIEIVGDEVEVE